MLANCYRNSLALAKQHAITSIAFPSISTGVYRFPLERAAKIAVSEVVRFLDTNVIIEKVIFVCFGSRAYRVYEAILKEGAAQK